MTFKQQILKVLNFNKMEPAVKEMLEAAILCVDDSFDGIRQTVQTAIQAALDKANPKTYSYYYVRDMYPDVAIYSCGDGKLYRVAYSIVNDAVTLGIPEQVEVSYVLVSGADEAQECAILGDIVEVNEAAKDGQILIKVIQEGQGSMAYYPKDVLKRDAAALCPDGTQMFANHQTAKESMDYPVGDVTKLWASTVGNAFWDETGKDGPAVYTYAKPFAPYKEALASMKGDIGVSIRGLGRASMNEDYSKTTPTMTKFTGSRSVDFVTRAGAGGKIVEVFESLRAGVPFVKEAAPSRIKREVRGMTLIEIEESELTNLRQMAAKVPGLESRVNVFESRLKEQLAKAKAGVVITKAFESAAGKALHVVAIKRISNAALAGLQLDEAGTFDEAAFGADVATLIADETAYIESMRPVASGKIKNGGESVSQVAVDEAAVAAAKTRFENNIKSLGGAN